MLAAGYDCGYTCAVKTAVSIPDKIFKAADRLAERLGMSRSQLYADAVADYLRRHRGDRIRQRLDEVYSEESSDADAVLGAMQRRSMPSDDW